MVTTERWTTADLERFPDADDLRYEIINGELHVTKAPSSYDQVVAGRIAAALDAWSRPLGAAWRLQRRGLCLRMRITLFPMLSG
jgi:hypothetical protein